MKISPKAKEKIAIKMSNEKELFKMMLAWMYFFCPRRMAKRVFPPTPTIMDMAMMNRAMGKQRVMPAMPRLPTPWPTKKRSTML